MFIYLLFIVFYFLLSLVLSLLLFVLPIILLKQNNDFEKISAYECGFVPFSNVRAQFEIKFYFVGVSFILFDIEFSFLFPWVVNVFEVGIYGIFVLLVFLLIVLVGYIFEWVNGVFDW